MKIEIWSDVICPFCYIGKRILEKVLSQLFIREQIQVEWKSYQLDPDIPVVVNNTYVEYLAKKSGISTVQSNEVIASVTEDAKQIGLDFHFDRIVMTNSFKAHLLIQFAKTRGRGSEMEGKLFKAFFTEGLNISDMYNLIQLGVEVGLEEPEIVNAFANTNYANAVKRDIDEAGKIGLRNVPLLLLDGKFTVSGTQPPEVLLNSISKVYRAWSVLEQI